MNFKQRLQIFSLNSVVAFLKLVEHASLLFAIPGEPKLITTSLAHAEALAIMAQEVSPNTSIFLYF